MSTFSNKETSRGALHSVNMELSKVLMLLAALWTISLALPVPVDHDTVTDASPNQHQEDKSIYELIESANHGVARPLIHGDIALNIFRRLANCEKCLWPVSEQGVVYVPYVVSAAYSDIEKRNISDAMEQIGLMTCVKFVRRTVEYDYIMIQAGPGCWSHVGNVGGTQVVNLDKTGCMGTGIIQHELMHTLGFYHEQSRPDRDNYISINWQFIDKVNWPNFQIEQTNNLDLPYDYHSVMHFQSNAYSNTTGKPSIVPIPDPLVSLGQRVGMSQLDVIKLNKLYKCNVCRTKLMYSGSFSSDDISIGPDGSCFWFLQTDFYKQIHLQLRNLNIPTSTDCAGSYIKIYNGYTTSDVVLLNKTCGSVILPPVISSGNNMLVEFVTDQNIPLSSFNAVFQTVI